MPKKRERLEVIYDILSSIQNRKIGPTRLLYASNLSPEMFKSYISELLETKMIKEIDEKNKKYYLMNDKGFHFIEQYKSFKNFIENIGL